MPSGFSAGKVIKPEGDADWSSTREFESELSLLKMFENLHSLASSFSSSQTLS